MRQPVDDLQYDITQLLLRVLDFLRGGVGKQFCEVRQIMLEEVLVLCSVHNFDAVLHLCCELQLRLEV